MTTEAATTPVHLPPGSGETLDAGGNTIEIKASAASTGGRFTLIDYVMRGDLGPPAHYHQETEEGFYVLEGACEIEVGDATHTARAGDYVRVPRGEVHRLRRVGDGPVRFLAWFVPGGFEGYFREIVAMVHEEPTWPPADPERLTELGRRYDQHLPVDETPR